MKLLFIYALVSAISVSEPVTISDRIDSTVVISSRAGRDTPVPNNTVQSRELRKDSPMNSLPMSLNLLPSVVSTNEGGTGVGYTALRIRGVPGSQTNVSLNGITLNGAEDQEVFWVNIPSIGRYLGSVQLQRGLGTSTSGPGAFGASINMLTESLHSEPGGAAEVSYGYYNTFTGSIGGSSGVLRNGLFADAAFSYNSTSGYRYGAFGKVGSVFFNGGWKGADDVVKLTFLAGKQRTGITWEGITPEQYGIDRRFNPAEGNTDNYTQAHVQVHWDHVFGEKYTLASTLNYTNGYGYYEYVPRRDALANDLFVLRSELRRTTRALKASAGVYLSHYICDHFGREDAVSLYENRAIKREADAWLRAEWAPFFLKGSSLYADMQLRALRHEMNGPDEYGSLLAYDETRVFFNPRVGANWKVSGNNDIFLSVALGHREPSRADIQENPLVGSEELLDFELGHKYSSETLSLSTTVYAMEYFNILVQTGRINSQGYAIKENAGRAWRRGVELSGAKQVGRRRIEGNIAFSTNRIKDGGNILLSPSVVGMCRYTKILRGGGEFAISGKYVGKQYWDNSFDPSHLIPSYFVVDMSLRHILRFFKKMAVSFYFGNIFNRFYYSYATNLGLYPQAPFNFSAKLDYTF